MCLNCSGVHRGLGVHISFIRSISMDGLKAAELLRMKMGGNNPWKRFFDNHEMNKVEGKTFESCTVKERYDSDVGEEWKERLTAKVEGKEWVPGIRSSGMAGRAKEGRNGDVVKMASSPGGSRSQTPLARTRTTDIQSPSSRSESPSLSSQPASALPPTRKAQNEAYFAHKGQENASRPDSLPPSQGGKFGGFGSEPAPSAAGGGEGHIPGINEFQKDPVAALTKGFGWLSSTVGKSAKTGFEGYIKPGMQKVRWRQLEQSLKCCVTGHWQCIDVHRANRALIITAGRIRARSSGPSPGDSAGTNG